jgi:hypothetical protein
VRQIREIKFEEKEMSELVWKEDSSKQSGENNTTRIESEESKPVPDIRITGGTWKIIIHRRKRDPINLRKLLCLKHQNNHEEEI